MSIDSEVIIIGGGLTGNLAALALADAGLSIILVDADSSPHMLTTEFDGRTTALAYASTRVFQHLGIWEHLEADASPINDILVTDGSVSDRFRAGKISKGFIHFDSTELGEEGSSTPLGWIVENRHMRSIMHNAITKHPSIELREGALCDDVAAMDAGARITLQDDTKLTSKLVVAADGRQSRLRDRAKIKTSAWSYPQTGIVCTVRHEKDHMGIAQEVFLPGGPFAILPLTDNRSSLVWTEKSDRAQSFMNLPDSDFLKEVSSRFGPYLGELELTAGRWSYPLGFHIASKFCADRMVLIGDAAHGIHPIAGQGYNLGVKDIAALRDTLVEAISSGLDIGHGTQLAKYERWRRFDSATLAFGTDFLNRLMSIDNPLLRKVRNSGMAFVNRTDVLRRTFMRQAGADLGDLPSLMQK